MAKRGRAPKGTKSKGKGKSKSTIVAKDFRYPGEIRLYWQGVGGVIALFIWLAVVCIFAVKTENGASTRWDVVAEVLIWPVLAVAICNLLSVRGRQKEFKARDAQSRVMSSNYPDVFRALGEFAKLAGMKKAPEMFILNEDRPFIFTMPAKGGTIVTSRGLKDGLRPPEFLALVAHEMGHIIAKHVRTELAIIFIRGANIGFKVLLVPVTLMSTMMGAWLDAVDYTADRCAFLMTGGNSKLVNAAIVKLALLAASSGSKDVSHGLTIEELEGYLSTPGDLARDQGLMELQVRAAQFISGVANLKDRIDSLKEYPSTAQAEVAMAKVAAMLRLPGAAQSGG
jgi:Zn-dependent protease with chaperone function